ncbi:MAG: 30S ribosomal protein S11 [Candidatus Omnitrophota bacterium]|nr:30S ribosomal protein S11 [Candidatus Omnitrophota bacterium]MBU2528214.1 30S ribosomal protein S11 [bacterium]MBU3929592.1 30S ribosomal protein S11 [bacterium]MBU4122988.1 30S ribosomal protein S11 [bacterium]
MATTATKKRKIHVKEGKIYVLTSYNNTIVTVTDMKGNVIASSSAGANGFKGARKGTTYASGVVAATASQKAREMGMERVDVFVNGPGSGRESALRSVQGAGIRVSSVRDITPIPHNGCRPKKKRRV